MDFTYYNDAASSGTMLKDVIFLVINILALIGIAVITYFFDRKINNKDRDFLIGLEEWKLSIDRKMKAEFIANLLAKQLSPHDDKKIELNSGSWSAALILPSELYLKLAIKLTDNPNVNAQRELISELRDYMNEGKDPIKWEDIVFF